MAWEFQFLDTFAHYTLAQATTKGKWTAGGLSTSLGPSDDSFITGDVGTLTYKTFTGYASQAAKPTGRIIAVRCTHAFNYSDFIDICGVQDSVTNDQVRLQIHDVSGQLRVIGPGGYIQLDNPQQLPLTIGELHNYQLAVWWNSGAAKYDYEVRVDNIPITNLTVTAGPNASGTPGLDIITLNPQISKVGMHNLHWLWTSQYTNTGGIYQSTDFIGNVKRGVQYSDADSSLYPATAAGAEWTPSSGTDYFSRINETFASESQYIKTTTDPGGAPTDLSRAAYEMANVSSSITSVVAVQRSTLIHAEVGTGTVKLFTRSKGDLTPANTTLDAIITPLSSPTIVSKAELVDPRDGGAWSRTRLNTLERGIETQDLT